MTPTEIKTIIFSEKISASQIPLFRGAIMAQFPKDEIMLHNHLEDKYKYAYPLIQYKCINGYAAIVAIGDGAALLQGFSVGHSLALRIGHEAPKTYTVSEIIQRSANLDTGSDLLYYRMSDWIPLNQQNYKEYNSLCGIVERTLMLEKILVGNILSAAKGLGCHIDRQLICKITKIHGTRMSEVKNVKMLAMDIEFCTNILLPDHIGLGKSVSKGHGVIRSVTDK